MKKDEKLKTFYADGLSKLLYSAGNLKLTFSYRDEEVEKTVADDDRVVTNNKVNLEEVFRVVIPLDGAVSMALAINDIVEKLQAKQRLEKQEQENTQEPPKKE